MKKNVLLLSAYRSDSHASWCDWLQQEVDVDWRVLELPGRYFRWRIRGNPLSWLQPLSDLLLNWQPDHILATSMVDIATIRGLFPVLAQVPLDYYFHENQFAYPTGDGQHSSLDPHMVQLYGALAADRIFFNSDYNQQSFLSGVTALMKKMPDHKPDDLASCLRAKSQWLPVPVNAIVPEEHITKEEGLILWNHRWEYDKRPEDFYAILQRLQQIGVCFKLALLGPRAQKTPAVLEAIRDEFSGRIVVDGRVSRSEYEHWLQRAQVVVSCAIHEFQGLSMLEAVSAGATPVVPDDLCYREQYSSDCRYVSGDIQHAANKVVAAFAGALQVNDISPWLVCSSNRSSAQQWHTLYKT